MMALILAATLAQRANATQVYDRYSDGKPRTVIYALPDQVALARHTKAGRVVVRQRIEYDEFAEPVGIQLVDLVGDNRDEVVIDQNTHTRNPGFTIYQMTNERLNAIANGGAYWGFRAPDLDGDGTPEILSTACCIRDNACEIVGISIVVLRYDGKVYRDSERSFVDAFTVGGRESRSEEALALPPLDERAKQYIFRIYNGDGAAVPRVDRAIVRNNGAVLFSIDGTTARQDVPISFADECVTLDVEVSGSPQSELTVFLEEAK